MTRREIRTAKVCVTLILLGTAASIARAQSVSPYTYNPQPTQVFESEITVTATGVEVDSQEVPAPTTVISREEMDDAQADNAADVLRRVPGVTVMRSGDEGKQTSVFTRGTNSNQTLVLFDGVRLNSPYIGGYDLSLLTTAGLDRIEVARGPYSALWGADAVGGVINVIPQRGQNEPAAHLLGEWGETGWERYQGDVTLGGQHLGLFLSGFYRTGDGELENSDFSTEQVLLDLGWSWGKRGSRLAVIAQDLDTETGIPYVTPGVPTLNRRQETAQRLVAVPLRWAIGDHWAVEVVGSSIEREFSFRDPEDPFGLTDTDTSADTVQARLASHHTFGGNTLSWGGEWRSDEVTDSSNLGTNLDGTSSDVTSAFLQDVWQASDALRLIIGVRWDDTERWGDELSPRLNLGWKMSKTLELRVGYGEAFRQPTLGELYFPLSGNPELEPETSASYELDLVYTPSRGKTRWQVNLFATDLENLIEFDFASFLNRNIGTAEIRGAEAVVETRLTGVSYQQIQLSWLDTSDEAGDPLLRRPEWSGSYTLGGLLWYHLRGDISLFWVGERDDVDPETFERTAVDDHFTVDLALAWEVTSGIELTLRVRNLLNEEYQEVLGYPAPARRFMGGIRAAF
jgi:vitamin B12 transporter